MRSLRLWCAVIVVWTCVLCRADDPDFPIRITPFVGEFAVVAALAILVWGRLCRVPLFWLAVLPLPGAFALKAGLGYPVLAAPLSENVADIAAIVLSAVLAARAGRVVEEFRRSAAGLMWQHVRIRPRRFKSAQGPMYEEVRRARLRKQPLALLSIEPRAESVKAAVDRFLAEAQRAVAQDYVAARLGEFLCRMMRGHDVAAGPDGRFTVLLPETTADKTAETAQRIRDAASQRLGLELAIGRAHFPDEEVTLVGLLERAEEDLCRQVQCRPAKPERTEGDSDGPSGNGKAPRTAIQRPDLLPTFSSGDGNGRPMRTAPRGNGNASLTNGDG